MKSIMEHEFEYYGSKLKIIKWDCTDDAFTVKILSWESGKWEELEMVDEEDMKKCAEMLKQSFGKFIFETLISLMPGRKIPPPEESVKSG